MNYCVGKLKFTCEYIERSFHPCFLMNADCSMGPRAAASVTQQANQNNNSFILSLISLPYPLHHPKLQIKL